MSPAEDLRLVLNGLDTVASGITACRKRIKSTTKNLPSHGKKKEDHSRAALDHSDDATMLWILQQGRENGLSPGRISTAARVKGLAISRAQRALDRLKKRGWVVWVPNTVDPWSPEGSIEVFKLSDFV